MLIFYWLIAIMPFDEHPFWGRALVGTLTIVKLVGIVALVISLCKLAMSESSPRVVKPPQVKWYALFLLFQCASLVIHSGHLAETGGAVSHILSIGMMLVIVPTMIDTFPRLNRSLLVAIGSIGFVSLYAVRQGQKYGADFRASGLFNDSNEYALIVGLWAPMAFLWLLARRPLWERILCLVALGSSLIGTTLAASRGSSIALAAAVLYLVCRSKRPILKLAVLSIAALPFLVLFPHSVLHRLQNPDYADRLGMEARQTSWKAGYRMIQSHPLAGVGIQNFKSVAADYQAGEAKVVVTLAHNTYIEVTAELGIGGIVAFVGIILAALYSLEISRRRALRVRATHLANIALGLQAGVIQFAIGAFFITVWFEKMVWLLLFMTIVVERLSTERMMRRRPRIRRRAGSKRAEETDPRRPENDGPLRGLESGIFC